MNLSSWNLTDEFLYCFHLWISPCMEKVWCRLSIVIVIRFYVIHACFICEEWVFVCVNILIPPFVTSAFFFKKLNQFILISFSNTVTVNSPFSILWFQIIFSDIFMKIRFLWVRWKSCFSILTNNEKITCIIIRWNHLFFSYSPEIRHCSSKMIPRIHSLWYFFNLWE